MMEFRTDNSPTRLIRRVAPWVAGLALAACFDSEPELKKPSELIAEKIWRFQSIAYDLGEWQGNAVVFGGGNMKTIADSAAPDTGLAGTLFPSGRSCFYGAEWENPGACLLDDAWDFLPGGTLVRNAGSSLCDSTQPVIENGTWSMAEGSTELRMSVGMDSAVFQIETVTGSTLRFSETATDSAALCGKTVVVKTTYSFVSP